MHFIMSVFTCSTRMAMRFKDFESYTDFTEGGKLGKGSQGDVLKVFMGDQVYAIKKIPIHKGWVY